MAKRSAKESNLTLRDLGERVAGAVGRGDAYNATTVLRFLNGTKVAEDVAEGFRVFFHLPHPVFFPTDEGEALEFQAVRDRRAADAQPSGDDERSLLTDGQRQRLAALRNELSALERELTVAAAAPKQKRQRAGVSSEKSREDGPDRGRPRRASAE